jgi:hypothetical protein
MMKNIQGNFQIYGRMSYEQPLTFIKEIDVKQSVAEETLAAVGDEGWVELIAVPTDALHHVTGKEENG